jgi:hypothetical protein
MDLLQKLGEPFVFMSVREQRSSRGAAQNLSNYSETACKKDVSLMLSYMYTWILIWYSNGSVQQAILVLGAVFGKCRRCSTDWSVTSADAVFFLGYLWMALFNGCVSSCDCSVTWYGWLVISDTGTIQKKALPAFAWTDWVSEATNSVSMAVHRLRLLELGLVVSSVTRRPMCSGGVVGWGTAAQDGRSWVRFPGGSLEIFKDPGVYSSSNRNEYQRISLGVKCDRRVQLTTVPCWSCRMSK